MISIIKSALETNDIEFVKRVIDEIELSKVLRPDEKELCKDIRISLNSKIVPSVDLLLIHHPSFTNEFNSSNTIDRKDIFSEISIQIAKRSNKQVGRELLGLAEVISKDGLTDENMKKINNLLGKAMPSELDKYINPMEEARQIYEDKKKLSIGLKTGVNAIDDNIGGMHAGSCNTIFAYTGSYKTTFAVNIAYKNAMEGYNVVYISLEVVKADLLWNIYSRHSFTLNDPKYPILQHDRIRKMELKPDEEAFLFDKLIPDLNNTMKGKLYLLDESDMESNTQIGYEKKLRELEKKAIDETGHGIDCVCIDQMSLLKYDKTGSSDYSEGAVINKWADFFRRQCLNFVGTGRPITVIMLTQANREGWKRAVKNEGRYDLRAISEANELERCSWRVFSIFTDENMKESKEAKVQILKNRTGRTMYDPAVVYVDPVAYVFGDVVSGFNNKIDVSSLDDLFGDSLGDLDF